MEALTVPSLDELILVLLTAVVAITAVIAIALTVLICKFGQLKSVDRDALKAAITRLVAVEGGVNKAFERDESMLEKMIRALLDNREIIAELMEENCKLEAELRALKRERLLRIEAKIHGCG